MKLPHPISIAELLQKYDIAATVKGKADNMITGINELHSLEVGDLSFVDHAKYYTRMLQSKASVILINEDVECPEGKTLLITKDPLAAYLKVVRDHIYFHPQEMAIHPSAIIGEGTVVQPCTFIGENVVIGKNCLIHSNVSIYADSVIGDNVVIHSGSVIGADACYFQKRADGWLKLDSCGRTVIGNDVEIGCNVCIDRGVSGDTSVGDGCKFDNFVQIGHDTQIGKHCLFGSQSGIAGCSRIEDDCVIWAKSVVNKDLVIAKGTTILAVSAVDKSITEEGTTVFGTPAIEAQKKWREMVSLRQLPEQVRKLQQEIEELKKSK
ncbi:MAG: UDP-3-O-(3-hydroxymyristoyl)glucosamine N-acyltransferase [Bacteroidales bacterium]|nr:UDP-3-O-(3-hydroxymyristoyl)glucosamine N-acyltransferase [Bacteroidales bacterium]